MFQSLLTNSVGPDQTAYGLLVSPSENRCKQFVPDQAGQFVGFPYPNYLSL